MENLHRHHSWTIRITSWAAFTVALFVSAQAIYGEVPLGIGIVNVNFNEKTVIHFYDRPGASSPAKTIRFFDDKSINSWSIVDLDSVRSWLAPQAIWLDYSHFNFRCTARRPGWFQVIVNNETGKTYWVRASRTLTFETWEAFLADMFSIARLDKFPQPLRSRPSTTSREVRFRGRDCFDLIAMRGDWIHVKQAGHCEEPDRNFRSGWIRWRRGQTMLIEYFPVA
jgi:hypothetical protein